MIHVPAYELPASDRNEIGLSSVAKIDTDVTHHGTVPSLLKSQINISKTLHLLPPSNLFVLYFYFSL